MALGPLTLRCPRCAGFLSAAPVPVPYATWCACPHCGYPVPVLAPRDRAPLFSWEAYPQLYGDLPRGAPDRRGVRRTGLALLIAATVLVSGLAVLTGYDGALAFSPGPFEVVGSVWNGAPSGFPGTVPLAGATIQVRDESGAIHAAVSGSDGRFQVGGVPPGRVDLNVSARGYEPASFELFASAPYSSRGADGDPLVVALFPVGSTQNGTNVSSTAFTPFDGLEPLIASLWSGTALLVLGAIVGGAGALWAVRDRRPAVGTAGGVALAAAPIPLFLLSIPQAFPIVGWLSALAVTLGALAAGFEATRVPSGDPENSAR
ncbi:MAG TPA: carboxypeptidase-like regulatory domain-containing protein [Thermoplasmata archaeon]|nr:carboxypeptidase-like regulatory domain-containing protein [Thermoplasmata archaeon]